MCRKLTFIWAGQFVTVATEKWCTLASISENVIILYVELRISYHTTHCEISYFFFFPHRSFINLRLIKRNTWHSNERYARYANQKLKWKIPYYWIVFFLWHLGLVIFEKQKFYTKSFVFKNYHFHYLTVNCIITTGNYRAEKAKRNFRQLKNIIYFCFYI